MTATLSKGTTKILVVVVLFLSISVLSYSGLALSYQKVHLGDNTLRIQTSLGEPILDIQLLENTDQCLVNCHAILKFTPHQSFSLPVQPSDADNIQFLQANPSTPGLRSHSFEILEETPYTVSTPIYQTTSAICTDNSSRSYECTTTVQTGSTTDTHVKQQWHPFTPWGFTFEPGTSYTIKITGQKIPRLGQNNIDWVLTLRGIPLREWAWWNSNWQYRKQITIVNNNLTESVPQGYSINLTFDHKSLVDQGKSLTNGYDISVVVDNSLELDRKNSSSFNENRTTLWFGLQQNLSAGGTNGTSYSLYYGNPLAGAPSVNVFNIFLFYDDFDDNSCLDWTFQGSWTCESGYMESVSGSSDDPVAKHSIGYTLGSVAISYQALAGGASRPHAMLIGNRAPILTWDGTEAYIVGRPSGAWRLERATDADYTTIILGSDSPVTGQYNNVSLFRTSLALWNLSGNQQNQGNATDSTYTNTAVISFFTEVANNNARIENVIMRKYVRPEPTTALGPEESVNGSIHIIDFLPIQTVRNVSFVSGKKMLVRLRLAYLPGASATNHTATLHTLLLNNIRQNFTNYSSNPLLLQPGTDNVLDVFFFPRLDGNDVNLTIEVATGVPNYSSIIITQPINLTRTRHLNLTFISVHAIFPDIFRNGNPFPDGSLDGGPSDYLDTALRAQEFLNETYPLADDGVISNVPTIPSSLTVSKPTFYYSDSGADDLDTLRDLIYQAGQLPGTFPEVVVGVVHSDFFSNITGRAATGLAKFFNPTVLVSDRTRVSTAHEIGHYFGLCDESSAQEWSVENQTLSTIGLHCPNGDTEPPPGLDDVCLNGPFPQITGCQTLSVEPLSHLIDDTILYNIMSSFDLATDQLQEYWITNQSFEHLLSHVSHFSPVAANNRVMVTGRINRSNGTAEFGTFYTLGGGLAENITATQDSGEFLIRTIAANGSTTQSFWFDLSFVLLLGNSTSINLSESSFSFVLPLPSGTAAIELLSNGTLKATRNVSASLPTVTVVSPNDGEDFSNEQMNVSWIATDADADVLTYSVLTSSDNGSTFNTIALGVNTTSVLLNSSVLGDSALYRMRVLATDGVNTGNDTSDGVFSVDNDLNVTDVDIVNANASARVFRVSLNNTLDVPIPNIGWTINLSDGSRDTSDVSVDLEAHEVMSMFVYHNFTLVGNASMDLVFRAGDLVESMRIMLVI